MRTNGRLDRDIKLLARDQIFHLLNQFTATALGVVAVGNQRQRIDTFVVDKDINTHHVRRLEAFEVIVQRRVAARGRLQTVKEIEYDFRHRNLIRQRHLITVVNHIGLDATLLDTQGDDIAKVSLRQQHVTLSDRLTQFVDVVQRRQLGRTIDVDSLFRRGFNFVDYGRRGGDQIQIVFTLQTFLNDLHVQQTKEATTEAEA